MTDPRTAFLSARAAYLAEEAEHDADDPAAALHRAHADGHRAVQLFLRDDDNTRETDPAEYERRRRDATRWEDERIRLHELAGVRTARLSELHAAYVAAALRWAEAEADTTEGTR